MAIYITQTDAMLALLKGIKAEEERTFLRIVEMLREKHIELHRLHGEAKQLENRLMACQQNLLLTEEKIDLVSEKMAA